MSNKLAELIKNKREAKKLSQRELAKKIHVDNATISKIENGITKKPSIDIIMKLSNELEISTEKLFDLSGYNFKETFKSKTLGDFERVANELIRVKEENQELKKQLEEYKKFNNKLLVYNATINYNSKKFIKYLEDERKKILSSFNTDGIPIIEVELLDVVLENYKKIMGLKRWKKK